MKTSMNEDKNSVLLVKYPCSHFIVGEITRDVKAFRYYGLNVFRQKVSATEPTTRSFSDTRVPYCSEVRRGETKTETNPEHVSDVM